MKYRDKIIAYFESAPDGSIIAANELYGNQFSKMSEAAFFKSLERLAKDGIITRISKGLYTKSDNVDRKQTDENVLNLFFGENNAGGMFIGYRLYMKYNLTKAKTDSIELYSNQMTGERCNIGNVHAKRSPVELNYENTRIIEALEILQNYNDIENLDKNKFARYARQFSKNYNDAAAIEVLNVMKYKKNTIAFMKKILDMYKVENTLDRYISHATRYKLPSVQRVAR